MNCKPKGEENEKQGLSVTFQVGYYRCALTILMFNSMHLPFKTVGVFHTSVLWGTGEVLQRNQTSDPGTMQDENHCKKWTL